MREICLRWGLCFMGNSAHKRHEVKFLLFHKLSWVPMLLVLLTQLVSLSRVDIPAPAMWRGRGRRQPSWVELTGGS